MSVAESELFGLPPRFTLPVAEHHPRTSRGRPVWTAPRTAALSGFQEGLANGRRSGRGKEGQVRSFSPGSLSARSRQVGAPLCGEPRLSSGSPLRTVTNWIPAAAPSGFGRQGLPAGWCPRKYFLLVLTKPCPCFWEESLHSTVLIAQPAVPSASCQGPNTRSAKSFTVWPLQNSPAPAHTWLLLTLLRLLQCPSRSSGSPANCKINKHTFLLFLNYLKL